MPESKLPEHKIPSGTSLDLKLEAVPKKLGEVKKTWNPQTLLVSFKLETDASKLESSSKTAISKYQSDAVVANQLQNKSSKVVVYHSKSEPETIQLLTSEYSDQISEHIVDHLLERYELKKNEPEVKSEPKPKEANSSKKNDDKTDDVDSDNKFELHISNISLKANENELRKLFEEYGPIYRVKLLKRGTMQKAFIDMDNLKAAEKCI